MSGRKKTRAFSKRSPSPSPEPPQSTAGQESRDGESTNPDADEEQDEAAQYENNNLSEIELEDAEMEDCDPPTVELEKPKDKRIPEGPHTRLKQRFAGRYSSLDANTIIDRMNRYYGEEQNTSLPNPNPFLVHAHALQPIPFNK